MIVGYARVSTQEQNIELQIYALNEAGCEIIFQEKRSGTDDSRPEFKNALNYVRKGDTFVVWKIDRLGRNALSMWKCIIELQEKGVTVKSLKESVDTSTLMGQVYITFLASIAQTERENISIRTKAGLDNARRKGRKLGRPFGISKTAKDKAKIIKALYDLGTHSVTDICKIARVSKPTYYSYLKMEQELEDIAKDKNNKNNK